jgi:drug/metabolite transporter (DMT)-like permease
VLLACVGVFVTVYGSAEAAAGGVRAKASNAFLGNVMVLVSAVSYALYQVGYKKWAVPGDSVPGAYEALATADEAAPSDRAEEHGSGSGSESLPFGLFANFVTSTVGLATFVVLWIPMAVSSWVGEGGFEVPGNWWTVGCVGMIAAAGLVYNAGFMVSLSSPSGARCLNESRFCYHCGVRSSRALGIC